MKCYIKKLRDYMDRSLRRQLVFYLMVGVLLPLTIVTSVLFIKAKQEMKSQAVLNIRQRSEAAASRVDELLHSVESLSDTLSYDTEIENVIRKTYDDAVMEKQRDINDLIVYFNNVDPFAKNKRLSGIYTRAGEVINFINPGHDGADVKRTMMEMGATDKEYLSVFRWYPLQDNFLKGAEKENASPRDDKAAIGMRRIMDSFTGSWNYTQFFAVTERELYELYRESASEIGASVYILDESGALISSTDEQAVKTGILPESVSVMAEGAAAGNGQIKKDGETYITDWVPLENASCSILTVVPVSLATATVDGLFKDILFAMALCIIACIVIITWISHRFLQPVEVLDVSMKEVYDGNLEAYVQPEQYHGEMKSMMKYYNAMLVSINRFITEQVESEKKKKELELEVLMGQINPHFLYNTLENIVWKSNEVGRPDIGRLAASLGRLYRLSIGNGETVVSIQQEIEHVMAYVNIQKNRYKERVEFDLRANYEEAYGYSMIKLSLQPIVENCYMYAMEGTDHVLKIRLSVRVKEETIEFRVTDNGTGMTEEQLLKVREQISHGRVHAFEEGRKKRKGAGIGLYSVKERISIYTGYQDSIQIKSKPGAGTMVVLTIPKITWQNGGNMPERQK